MRGSERKESCVAIYAYLKSHRYIPSDNFDLCSFNVPYVSTSTYSVRVCAKFLRMPTSVCVMFVQIDMVIVMSAKFLYSSVARPIYEMLRSVNLARSHSVCCISIHDDVYRFLPLFVCRAHRSL